MIIHFAQQDVIPIGQEDFFFAYALKNKALHWAASKWFSASAWANQWQHLPEFRELGSGTCYF
jgi:hypothetical protein